MTNQEITQTALLASTAAQRTTVEKATKLGWRVTQVLRHRKTGKVAVGLTSKTNVAWVTPDGKLSRKKNDSPSAYIDAETVLA